MHSQHCSTDLYVCFPANTVLFWLHNFVTLLEIKKCDTSSFVLLSQKLSGSELLCFSRIFDYCSVLTSNSYLQPFLFFPDLVLVNCVILRIYSFLLDSPICWLYSFLTFHVSWYPLLFLLFHFWFYLSAPSFSLFLSQWVQLIMLGEFCLSFQRICSYFHWSFLLSCWYYFIYFHSYLYCFFHSFVLLFLVPLGARLNCLFELFLVFEVDHVTVNFPLSNDFAATYRFSYIVFSLSLVFRYF